MTSFCVYYQLSIHKSQELRLMLTTRRTLKFGLTIYEVGNKPKVKRVIFFFEHEMRGQSSELTPSDMHWISDL